MREGACAFTFCGRLRVSCDACVCVCDRVQRLVRLLLRMRARGQPTLTVAAVTLLRALFANVARCVNKCSLVACLTFVPNRPGTVREFTAAEAARFSANAWKALGRLQTARVIDEALAHVNAAQDGTGSSSNNNNGAGADVWHQRQHRQRKGKATVNE